MVPFPLRLFLAQAAKSALPGGGRARHGGALRLDSVPRARSFCFWVRCILGLLHWNHARTWPRLGGHASKAAVSLTTQAVRSSARKKVLRTFFVPSDRGRDKVKPQGFVTEKSSKNFFRPNKKAGQMPRLSTITASDQPAKASFMASIRVFAGSAVQAAATLSISAVRRSASNTGSPTSPPV